MKKIRSWEITARVRVDGKGEQTVTTFVQADSKKVAEVLGRRSVLHTPDILSLESVTARDCSFGPVIDPAVS